MKKMTHLERLLGALYVSEAYYTLWSEHKKPGFKARAIVTFDRALQFSSWADPVAHGIRGAT